jgi:hypothetical protein
VATATVASKSVSIIVLPGVLAARTRCPANAMLYEERTTGANGL